MSAQGFLLLRFVGSVIVVCLLYVFAAAGGALWSLRRQRRTR